MMSSKPPQPPRSWAQLAHWLKDLILSFSLNSRARICIWPRTFSRMGRVMSTIRLCRVLVCRRQGSCTARGGFCLYWLEVTTIVSDDVSPRCSGVSRAGLVCDLWLVVHLCVSVSCWSCQGSTSRPRLYKTCSGTWSVRGRLNVSTSPRLCSISGLCSTSQGL